MDRQLSITKGITRGLVAVLALIYVPLLAAYLLFPLAIEGPFGDDEDYLFELFLSWSYVFVPHMWACMRDACPPDRWREWSFLQWTVVGVVLGGVTRSSSRPRLAWLTVLAAVSVTLVAHFGLRAMGYSVALDFP